MIKSLAASADHLRDASPWVPMKTPIDVKHLGKLMEELGELQAAIARCLIQGIDEKEPVTGKPNRQWLEEEMADVYTNLTLCVEHFGLDECGMRPRIQRKLAHLRQWHGMLT